MDGTVGQCLEDDHHRIDEGFAQFARSLSGPAPDRVAFEEAARALRHHIHVEEVLHFPVLRAAGLLGPVLVMLREHGEIWDLLDATEGALLVDDVPRARGSWEQLADVLEQHNLKEERILYPAGDERIAPADAELILATLASGEMPADWRCEMATEGLAGRTPLAGSGQASGGEVNATQRLGVDGHHDR